VFDLVPAAPGLTYVGRLDYLTEGVLLLTTDGDAAHVLTHPSSEIERTYVAIVRGNLRAAVAAAREGVELEDGVVEPKAVDGRSIGNRMSEFEVTLTEGKNREVRRLCEAVGLEVERLVRVRFGPIELGTLASGATRSLTTRERHELELVLGRPLGARSEREARPERPSRRERPAGARGRPTRDRPSAGGDRPSRDRPSAGSDRPPRDRPTRGAGPGRDRPHGGPRKKSR
jgi:pseudouridine synthase